jgi:hypothetical protein
LTAVGRAEAIRSAAVASAAGSARAASATPERAGDAQRGCAAHDEPGDGVDERVDRVDGDRAQLGQRGLVDQHDPAVRPTRSSVAALDEPTSGSRRHLGLRRHRQGSSSTVMPDLEFPNSAFSGG